MEHYLFVGPTLYGHNDVLKELAFKISVQPPISRGAVTQLLQEPPGIISICDGIFHSYPAVGHAELVEAIERGWEIWGISSMGAIRASELAHLGMRGFGKIFKAFESNPDLPDDAVALLHDPRPPYEPYSEPLIHLCGFLEHLEQKQTLNPEDAHHIADCLTNTWYGERTIPKMLQLIREIAPYASQSAREKSADFEQFRIKTQDLLAYLTKRPWER